MTTQMNHDEFQEQEGRLFGKSFFVLAALTVIGMTLIAIRYIRGLGAVCNMSDGYPWGIWIIYDVATGTAIACGGYAVAILIYIRNQMRYPPHPLQHPDQPARLRTGGVEGRRLRIQSAGATGRDMS